MPANKERGTWKDATIATLICGFTPDGVGGAERRSGGESGGGRGAPADDHRTI